MSLSVTISQTTGPVTVNIHSPPVTAAASSSAASVAQAAIASSSSSSSSAVIPNSKKAKPQAAPHRKQKPQKNTGDRVATISAKLFAKFYPVETAVQGKLPGKRKHACVIKGPVKTNNLILISGAEKALGEHINLGYLSNPLAVGNRILIWDHKEGNGHYLATIKKIAGSVLTINYDDFGTLEENVSPSRWKGFPLYNCIVVKDASILPSLKFREDTCHRYDPVERKQIIGDATGKVYDLSGEE